MKKLSFILLLMLVCLAGCTGNRDDVKTGAIALKFSPVELQTLLPDIMMTISTYDILGSGPNGASFNVSNITEKSFTKNSLAFGEWNITVNGKNADGIVIGQGQATAMVHSNETTTVSIVIRPLEGLGALDLTVNWNAADTELPAIDAELVPPSGASQVLDFTTTNGNTGTYTNTAIQNGYYSLIVKLMDNGALTMGAVEVVRIVKDGTTTGVYNFTEINQPGGSIIINITPEMDDPIDVAISGQQSQITLGSSMTVTASVPTDIGNVTYVWYINGVTQNTGETFTISNLEEGVYRLDVTAFAVDNSRAGSATYNFNVVAESDNPEIFFADPNLENLVRNTIGDFDTPIYASEVLHVTELTGWDQGITSLRGLEYFTNLEQIRLYYNQISDISPLANLSNLFNLDLDCNQISDINPLANMTKLIALNLNGNQISDISPLVNLTNLNFLVLNSTQISDISPLANLTNLNCLDLGRTQISDISSLANLTNLTNLYLSDNQISDISPLTNLIKLTDLELSRIQTSDISSLANLTNLANLLLNGNQISNISSLTNLTSLNYLDLSWNQISDISPLTNLANLSYLNLSNNQITDIQPLVDNSGIAESDNVDLTFNYLDISDPSSENMLDIVDLTARGLDLYFSPQH